MGRMRRHWLTGEWEEVPYELVDGRAVISRIEPDYAPERHGYAYNRPFESTSLAIHADQVKSFNEAAHAAGTGAYYKPDGTLVCESRGARNRELARRGQGDADAGYGDRPPGG